MRASKSSTPAIRKNQNKFAWWNPWKADTKTNVWFNSLGHASQLAFDQKRQLLYMSAGDSELQVLDVRRSAKPRFVKRFGTPKNGQAAWGVTVHGDTAYLSYIKAMLPFQSQWSGLRAVDVH